MTDAGGGAAPSTILLTGSAGGIGRHLLTLLRDHGHHVRGMDVIATPDAGPDLHVADLRDRGAVRRLAGGVDAIVHAGAIPYDIGDPADVMTINVSGTWNVLQAAVDAGVRRVVAFSSINASGVVGGWRRPDRLPIDDAVVPHPMTPYQLSKHLGEEICRSFSERHGIVTLCLRPTWVTHPHHYTGAGFGTDAFERDWADQFWGYVDVRDVGEAVLRCLALDGVVHDRFLLSAADTSARQLTRDLVAHAFPDVPWTGPDLDAWLAADPHRSLIDTRHARDVLGWEPVHRWRDAAGPVHHEHEA